MRNLNWSNNGTEPKRWQRKGGQNMKRIKEESIHSALRRYAQVGRVPAHEK